MKKNFMVDEANKKVSIFYVCALVGVDVEDGRDRSSFKTYCPFGRLAHSDGGREPAFRVYSETNSAYCFSCKRFFSPVSLYADSTDLSHKESAEDLLERTGYKKPSAEDLWNNVQPEDPEPDTAMLGKALRIYCERISSDWYEQQFSSEVADKLDKCLTLLDNVKTSSDSEKWLATCKEVMKRVLAVKELA